MESGVHIGTGASVVPGVTIGRRSIVGAGAVVVDDLPPGVTAVGVPARPIKIHPTATSELDNSARPFQIPTPTGDS